jgi:hypothetical protein
MAYDDSDALADAVTDALTKLDIETGEPVNLIDAAAHIASALREIRYLAEAVGGAGQGIVAALEANSRMATQLISLAEAGFHMAAAVQSLADAIRGLPADDSLRLHS